VRIPDGPKVLAHSDGDALLHALMDALLGCAGLGDIGQRFPDGEARFENISSAVLLSEVLKMTRNAGIRPTHADMTIVAQIPRITPWREEIRNNVARLLNLPAECVNLKAGTEEGMGFTGRCEGIKTYAVVSALADERAYRENE
jgi:2-C-methyl-D-erythritol 4-phosphate cytidylyltransferase/2-C-methyl-D-erythritol 2,4-cyclodiphosphate synthase